MPAIDSLRYSSIVTVMAGFSTSTLTLLVGWASPPTNQAASSSKPGMSNFLHDLATSISQPDLPLNVVAPAGSGGRVVGVAADPAARVVLLSPLVGVDVDVEGVG